MKRLALVLALVLLAAHAHASEIDKKKLVGGWKAEVEMFDVTLGLHEDGKYYTRGELFAGIAMIEIGRWDVDGDQLVFHKEQEIEVIRNQIRSKDKARTHKVKIVEVTENEMVTEHKDALDEIMRVEYERTEEIYVFKPPSAEEMERRKIAQLKKECESHYQKFGNL
jgi:hypothetical protein